MSRTRRFLGAISLGYISQALTMLTGLWLTPFLLYHIGNIDFGLWLVGTQFMVYLTLLDVGVVALLPRATAYATGRAGGITGARDLPEIVGQTARVVLWQMPVVAVTAAVLFLLVPHEWAALRWPLGIIFLVFVLLFPFRIFQAVLQGLQDLPFVSATQIVTWVLSTLLTIGLILAGWRMYALAIGWAAGQTLSPLILYWRLRTRFPQVLPSRLPSLVWNDARRMLTQGSWVSFGQIAQVLLTGTDLVIIGKLLGPAALVPYVCTGKLISVLSNQPQILMQTALPALSEMRTGESRERLFQVTSALSLAMLFLSGAVICVALVVNQGFVTWWVGADRYSGSLINMLLLLGMLLRHWNTTAVYSIFCFGYERRICITTLLDGVVTASCASVFVWLWGLVGAPLGGIVGVCLVSLPGNLSVLARENGVAVRTQLKTLWPWGWRFAVLAFAAWALLPYVSAFSIYQLMLVGVGTALVYCIAMLPVLSRNQLGNYLRPRVTFWVGKLPTALRLIKLA